jgi:hypothetical protein
MRLRNHWLLGVGLVLGAAVLAFRAQRGAYPDTLQQAQPDLAQDPFTGAPLKFRRKGERL